MENEKNYDIHEEDEVLTLSTRSFRVDRGSVLHSGIFNKELASSFVSAVIILAYIISVAVLWELRLVHYLIAALIFVIIFPLARTYIFKDTVLITEIDRRGSTVSFTLKRNIGEKAIKRPLDKMKDVRVEHVRIEPENPDGIAIVEKIALQHGTVIPGFGEVKEFFNVVMGPEDSKMTVLSSTEEKEAMTVADTLGRFISQAG